MTKKQKIWFAVFLAMFVIPEIIWPQALIILYFWLKEIFFKFNLKAGDLAHIDLFSFSCAPSISGILLFIKFIGILGSFIFALFFYRPKNKFIMFAVIISLGLLLIPMVFYILFALNFNNAQIG